MNKHSFMLKIVQERGGGIRFIRALEKNIPCWFYLRVVDDKVSAYREKLKTGKMDIRDYGEILESDWGDYPPQDVIAFMKKEYNFDTPSQTQE